MPRLTGTTVSCQNEINSKVLKEKDLQRFSLFVQFDFFCFIKFRTRRSRRRQLDGMFKVNISSATVSVTLPRML
jgi:hypothetical protein